MNDSGSTWTETRGSVLLPVIAAMRGLQEKRQQIVVIDFSRGSIKMAAAESAGEAARFTSITRIPLPPTASGEEPDPDDVAARVGAEVERRGWTGMRAACLLSRSATSTQSFLFPPMPECELREAIALKLEHTLHFGLDEASFDFRRVRESAGDGTMRVLTLVVAARKDAIHDALTVVRRAGLAPVAVGSAAESLARLALGANLCDPGEVTIHVDMGEDSTILNMFDGHLLRFSREIDTAGEAFTRALMQPIVTADGARQLTYEEAEQVQAAAGYPLEDEQLQLPHDVTAADVLSLMKPVAQRLSDEIRRSIDYLGGLLERADVDRIILSGSAGRMRNLDATLQSDLDTPVTFLDPVARALEHWRLAIRDADHPPLEGFSAILGYSLGGGRPINLMPREERIVEIVERTARIRKAVTPAALSVALVLALTGVPIARNYDSAREAMGRTSARLDERLRAEADLKSRHESVRLSVEQVVTARGHVPDWRGIMKELSALIPDVARIAEFSTRTTDGVPVIHLTAKISRSKAPFDVVSAQLAVSLGASPFFTNVHVVDASQGEDREGRFEATFEIVAGRFRPWELGE